MEAIELQDRRTRLGLTQRQLADQCGIGANTLSIYERGILPVPKWMALVLEALENRRVKELTAGR